MRSSFIIKLTLVLCLCLAMASPLSHAKSFIEGELKRTADLGFQTTIKDNQLSIRRIKQASPAELAGLNNDDRIIAINGQKLTNNLLDEQNRLHKWLGDQPLSLEIKRDGKNTNIQFTPAKRELEDIESVNSYYSSVKVAPEQSLRSIISFPDDKTKANPRPAIFFVQWVSCGSIEYQANSPSREVFALLIKQTQRALIRVERPSDGDSQGPACHQLDYNTELENYYQAYLQLSKDPRIDSNKIVIYGSSLGSTMAPLLAEKLVDAGIKVQGIMIQGGGAVTYLERMLAFERIYLERRPQVAVNSIHQQMLDRIQFQVEYLKKGRHPNQIAKDSPAMKRVRNDILGMDQQTHYGRPFAWHQQAANQNFLKAWKKVNAPVLVIYNQYDQFETEHGHRLIVDMINRWRPNTARLVNQEKIGHGNFAYESIESAYRFEKGTNATAPLAVFFSDWVNAL